jgi:hypothetical protein
MHIIACIEQPDVIERILRHLQRTGQRGEERHPQAPRAPPGVVLTCTLFDSSD